MRIGVPKEIKIHEYRVGLTPPAVRELTSPAIEVFVQSRRRRRHRLQRRGLSRAGAKIAADADDVFAESQLIVKVKEPQPAECARLRPRPGAVHLSPPGGRSASRREALIESQRVAIAYETVTAADGSLPLLTPMSEVAGRMSIQVGRAYLEKAAGRARHAARRRARRSARQGGRDRAGRRRHQCREHGASACGATSRRSIARCRACASSMPFSRRGAHALFHRRRHRARGRGRRSGDRRGAAAGCRGAEAGHARR